jgi:histidine ammonia-lyase
VIGNHQVGAWFAQPIRPMLLQLHDAKPLDEKDKQSASKMRHALHPKLAFARAGGSQAGNGQRDECKKRRRRTEYGEAEPGSRDPRHVCDRAGHLGTVPKVSGFRGGILIGDEWSRMSFLSIRAFDHSSIRELPALAGEQDHAGRLVSGALARPANVPRMNRQSDTVHAHARGEAMVIGRERLSVNDVLALARGELLAQLDPHPEYRALVARSRQAVERAEASGSDIYGVTTGVGASSGVAIPPELRDALATNLMRFHGVGTGQFLEPTVAGAVVALRLITLAKGHSGVRIELLERLCDFLNERLLPLVPEEGSVGASGDLTPLSYLAAAISGEREVTLRGRVMSAEAALAAVNLEPIRLLGKESLSLMNGTGVMTAIGCTNYERARRLARLAAAITAISVDVTHGNPAHFDPRVAEWKPHPGQVRSAAWIWDDLEAGSSRPRTPARLQDRYSIRCAPHVIGVAVDAITSTGRTLEIEINGIDDNSMVDPDTGEILHGGNFYGGHIAFAMDGLKSAIASVADLLDRQLALLCVPETSDGLSANLVAIADVSHHGFKAVQISTSALTAEALKLTMPATAFSRSTESHNQDKVSMGTIAARDCRRVIELAETVAVMLLLAGCQALDLRDGGSQLARPLALREAVRKVAGGVREDRRQDLDIARVLELLRDGSLPIGGY